MNRKTPKQKKNNIPQSRIPVYTAAIASLAMLIVLMIVFVPKRISHMNAQEQPPSVLRNPEVTEAPMEDPYQNSMFADPTLLGVNGVYTLSAQKTADSAPFGSEGLYALPPKTPLHLTAQNGMTADLLKTSLTVTKASNDTPIPVTVTEDTEGGFLITPENGAWQDDTLYRVTVRGADAQIPDFAAAFQTARPFSVKSVYPGNERTDIPTETGIEITFSDPVRRADFASFITITPAISGRFELYPNGKTVVIVPDKPLALGTQYAVQIKAGLTADNGQMLAQSTLSTFCTQVAEVPVTDMTLELSSDLTVDPGSTGSFPFTVRYNNYSYDTPQMDASFYAKIYAYSSADAAVAALRDGFSKRKTALWDETVNTVPTDGLSLVWEGEPETYIEDTSYRIKGYFYLPPLDAGTYLVDITATADAPEGGAPLTVSAQTFCQATYLRLYSESTRGETLLWVNRTDHTPTTAQGVEITANLFKNTLWMTQAEAASGDTSKAFRAVTALTDNDGLAVVSSDDTDTALLLLRHVDQTLIACVATTENRDFSSFRQYIYTDRAVYFPDDTVRLFGFLGAVYEGQTLPETLYLRFGGSETAIPLTVAPDGTFSGSFDISDWMGTYLSYSLAIDAPAGHISDDPYIIHYGNVRVTQEEKPIYTMDVAFDKLFYTYEDETVNVTVTTSFFDGTPAAGLKVSLYSNLSHDGETTLTTDENGQATYSYKAKLPYTQEEPSTNADMFYISANLIGYETVSLNAYQHAYYFHSSGVFEAERVNGQYSEVTLDALDTSQLLSEADFYYSNGYNDNTKGDGRNETVNIHLYKYEYIKTPTGTYYDPISKKTVEQYRWETKRTLVESHQAETENGVLRLEHRDASGFRGSYQYQLSWHDDMVGRTYYCWVYASLGRDGDYDPWSRAEQYYLESPTATALPGDSLTATLYYDNTPADTSALSVLFTRYAKLYDCVDKHLIANKQRAAYTFTFTEQDTLSSAVIATVFDGKSYIRCSGQHYEYDFQAANNADITVSSDRDTYKPGEDAVVTIKASALAGGTVLLSVVDEACFALGDIDTTPLVEYFQSLYGRYIEPMRDRRHSLASLLSGNIGGFYDSYQNKYLMSDTAAVEEEAVADMAPATGGGDNGSTVYVREEFLDNAAFLVLSLDENGSAVTTVKVPDNITSWRLSAIGVSGVGMTADGSMFSSGVRIGMQTGNVVCTLPFFLNVTLPDLFLCEDEIAFSARCAGTKRAENPSAAVTYTAVLTDETGTELTAAEASAAANDTAWFSFDSLPAGEYSVTVTGHLGDTADAVRVSFRVTETAQLIDYTETILPAQISSLQPAAFPLTLTFRDNTDSLYYETLRRLRWGDSGRTEALAARYAALHIEESVLGRQPMWYFSGMTKDDIADQINDYSGFLPLNPYAEGDPILTAEVLYCVPDILNMQNKAALVTRFEQLLTDDASDALTVSASLMALAAMGEPVLDQIYNAASYAASSPTDVKLYLASAFAAAGDLNAAEAALSSVTQTLGREMQDSSYCISDASTEEAIRLTALALMTASRLPGDETAYGMVRYLHNHTSTLDLYTLELAAFVTYYIPTSSAETLLSYTLHDSVQDIRIPRGQAYTVTLTRSDFEAFHIVSADTGVAVEASYGASPTVALSGKTDAETLTMTKTIKPFDAENGIYEVVLTFSGTTDADSLSFALTDTIPTGARFVRYGWNHDSYQNCSAWLSHDGGQQLHGSLYIYAGWKNPMEGRTPYSFSETISYLIRGAVQGDFTAEPALAISRDADTYAATDSYRITIKDGSWDIRTKE